MAAFASCWIVSRRQAMITRATWKEDLSRGMERAIWEYRSCLKRGVSGQGPFLVASNVPETEFKTFNMKQEDHWRACYEKSTSEVFIYGDPSPVHEAISRWFDVTVGNFCKSCNIDKQVFHTGAALAELSCALKEPDFSLQIAGSFRECPQVVAEVAHYSEGLEALRSSIREWTGPGLAAIALGVLVDAHSKKLVFLKKAMSSEEVEEIDFSPSKCNRQGQMVVQLDFGALGGGTQLDGKVMEFDLWHLQNRILRVDEDQWLRSLPW